MSPTIALHLVGTSQRELGAVVGFLDFYCGVFSLVALTLTVMGGVLAKNRSVLQPRHRLQAQRLHRALAGAAVGLLIIHIATRVVDGHVSPLDAGVPFLSTGRTLVGLGTVAAYLVLLLAVTGIARGRFAQRTRPTLWRVIHAMAYLAWPTALLHGLQAGRTPAEWVVASYQGCVALVVLAMVIRAITRRRRKNDSKRYGRVKDVPIPPPDNRSKRGAPTRNAKPSPPAPDTRVDTRRHVAASNRPMAPNRPGPGIPDAAMPYPDRPEPVDRRPVAPGRRATRRPDAEMRYPDGPEPVDRRPAMPNRRGPWTPAAETVYPDRREPVDWRPAVPSRRRQRIPDAEAPYDTSRAYSRSRPDDGDPWQRR